MAYYFSLLLIALAVSIDSFSVGFTYGLRKIRIPIKSIIIIACCSAITLLIAMMIGNIITAFLSPLFAERLGGFILMGIGAFVLYQFFRPEKDSTGEERILLNLEIKWLGVAITILRRPMTADFDKSGTITGLEALMLGIALSLDAFGAGIGAALLGYSPVVMAGCVAITSSLFVKTGIKCGSFFSKQEWLQRFSFVPGILLIILGVWKI